MNEKLILLEDINGLGKAGDTISVGNRLCQKLFIT